MNVLDVGALDLITYVLQCPLPSHIFRFSFNITVCLYYKIYVCVFGKVNIIVIRSLTKKRSSLGICLCFLVLVISKEGHAALPQCHPKYATGCKHSQALGVSIFESMFEMSFLGIFFNHFFCKCFRPCSNFPRRY